MRAGELKYRLTLLEPTTATNRFGEEEATYAATRTVHAERVKHTGRRSEEGGNNYDNDDCFSTCSYTLVST
jgi:head-tail adaptor